MCKRLIGWTIPTVAVLTLLGALPAAAAEVPAPASPPAVAQALTPVPGGCALALGLALSDRAADAAATCPAAAPASAEPVLRGPVMGRATREVAHPSGRLDPVFMGKPPWLRTCVCSCGYPCETDADCGDGGRCGPGITCC